MTPGDGPPADHRARLDEAPPQRERLVDERLDLGARNVDAALVTLEAQNLVGIDLEREVGENAGRVESGRCRHCWLRLRTTSFMASPRTAGPQPRDVLWLARPRRSDGCARRWSRSRRRRCCTPRRAARGSRAPSPRARARR